MSRRALLALLLLLVAGWVWMLWYDDDRSGPEEETAVGALSEYAPETLRAIEIAAEPWGDGRLERDGHGTWWLTQPFRWEADPEAVDALLRGLSEVSVLKVVTETPGDDLDAFGLANPEARLALFTDPDASPRRFELGGMSPLGSERYVLDDTGAVVLVDASVAATLRRAPESFMERRFVPVRQDQVRGITARGPASAFRVERRGDQWWLTEPLEDLADGARVAEMIWALDGLVASEVLDVDEIGLARGAFDESVTLTFDTGGGEDGPGVEIGAPAGPDRWFARRAGHPTFWGIVEAASLRPLVREAQELRERRLVRFSSPDVRAVRIESRGSVLTLSRRDARTWTASNGQAAAELAGGPVEAFLDRLRWLRARGFGAEGGGGAGEKIVEIVLSGDDARLGSVTLERLAGARGRGEIAVLLARSSWRPGFSFTVDAEFLDAVPRTVDDLRERPEGTSAGEQAE